MNRTFFMRLMMEKSASSPSPKWLFSVSGSKNPPPIFSVNRQIAVTMGPRHFHEIFAANGAQRAKKPMKGKIRARKKASKSCSQGTQSSTQECERALESCACLAVEHKTQLRARAREITLRCCGEAFNKLRILAFTWKLSSHFPSRCILKGSHFFSSISLVNNFAYRTFCPMGLCSNLESQSLQ